jgi:5-methylcytosine-specific restriction endonuclease McrA
MPGPYDRQWRRVAALVLDRDSHRCQLCGGPAGTVDHIIGLVDGGPRLDPTNLRALCRPCNSRRGALTARSRRTLPRSRW